MRKKLFKPTKRKTDYDSACKNIRVDSDPAAKLLASLILDGYNQEEQFIHYFSDIALIETIPGLAEDVISNTLELLNRVDRWFTFSVIDFKKDKAEHFKNKIRSVINGMYDVSDCNQLTIHVIKNMATYLCSKESIKMLQNIYIFNELHEVHFIYFFDEESYYLFKDKFNFIHDVRPIWLHRLPGEIDFNQKTQEHSLERMNVVTINSDIFTQNAKALINRAQRQADLFEEVEIEYISLLLAAAEGVESSVALEQCLNLTPERLQWLREDAVGEWKSSRNVEKHLFGSSAAKVVRDAVKLASASGYPDHEHPGLVSEFHLIGALSMCESLKNDLGTNRVNSFEQTVNKIADWYYKKKVSPSLSDRRKVYDIGYIHSLHRKMIGNIFGQQEALNVINEALCSDELNERDGANREGLRACFLFVGPEGVGKAYLARLFAKTYNLPAQYFNLSFYSAEQALPVKPPKESKPGVVLVFENLAEAQPSTIKQICQLIDSGKLKNPSSNEEVSFAGSIVILIATREISRKPIEEDDLPKRMVMCQRAALNSLQNEYEPGTDLPLIPPELLNLLDKHHIVVFNQLQVKDLLNICESKLVQYGTVIEESAGKRLTFHPLVPYAFLCNEGGKPKPRTLNTAVEMLISAEVRKFVSGYAEDSFIHLLTSYDRLHFTIENEQQINPEVDRLFRTERKPKILLLSERETAEHYGSIIKNVDWCPVSSLDALEKAAGSRCYDFALLDLWFNKKDKAFNKENLINDFISGPFWGNIRLPFSATALELFGEQYMHALADLVARLPVVMLNRIDDTWDNSVQEYSKRPSSFYLEAAAELRKIREKFANQYPIYQGCFRYDLFLEFLELFGARGMLNTAVTGENTAVPEEQLKCLTACIDKIHQIIYREKMAEELFNQGQVLAFHPFWELSKSDNLVTIRLKNMRLEEKMMH